MQTQKTTTKIDELFHGLSQDEMKEADETLRRYCRFIARLSDRIAAEEQHSRTLTEDQHAGSMDIGRTFTNQYSGTDV